MTTYEYLIRPHLCLSVRARKHLRNLRGTRHGDQSDSSSQCDTVDRSKPRSVATVVALNCSNACDATAWHTRITPGHHGSLYALLSPRHRDELVHSTRGC